VPKYDLLVICQICLKDKARTSIRPSRILPDTVIKKRGEKHSSSDKHDLSVKSQNLSKVRRSGDKKHLETVFLNTAKVFFIEELGIRQIMTF